MRHHGCKQRWWRLAINKDGDDEWWAKPATTCIAYSKINLLIWFWKSPKNELNNELQILQIILYIYFSLNQMHAFKIVYTQNVVNQIAPKILKLPYITHYEFLCQKTMIQKINFNLINKNKFVKVYSNY